MIVSSVPRLGKLACRVTSIRMFVWYVNMGSVVSRIRTLLVSVALRNSGGCANGNHTWRA